LIQLHKEISESKLKMASEAMIKSKTFSVKSKSKSDFLEEIKT